MGIPASRSGEIKYGCPKAMKALTERGLQLATTKRLMEGQTQLVWAPHLNAMVN